MAAHTKATPSIREIHGAYVTKVQAGPQPYGQKVTVADWEGYIILNIGDATYPAGLTAAEARYIAAQLNAAAARLDRSDA